MAETSPKKLLPVLVASLEDDGARDFLEGVAIAGGTAVLPLMVAPMDRSRHLLEIYTPSPTPRPPPRLRHGGRGEGDARRVPARRRFLSSFSRRGALGEPPRPPEPHARPRLRPGAGRAALHRDGVPRRQEPPRGARRGAPPRAG